MKNRLEELRKQRGIKQEDLANALEVSRQTIGSLENGRYNPSIQLAWKQVQMYCFWFFPRFRMVYLGAGACAVDHIALRGRRKHTDNHIWAFPAHFATLCSVLPSGHPSFYKCSILFLTQKPSFR